MNSRIGQIVLIIFLTITIAGCGIRNMGTQEEEAVDYTVVKEEDIPQEVSAVIEDKKHSEFQMTYQSGDYLYILRGYGLQNSGGYSIQVKKLTAAEDILYFQTELIGPSTKDQQQQNVSYPYIVVKMEYRDAPVIFE